MIFQESPSFMRSFFGTTPTEKSSLNDVFQFSTNESKSPLPSPMHSAHFTPHGILLSFFFLFVSVFIVYLFTDTEGSSPLKGNPPIINSSNNNANTNNANHNANHNSNPKIAARQNEMKETKQMMAQNIDVSFHLIPSHFSFSLSKNSHFFLIG